ncbi:MAG: hypothetical protein NT170_03220 [Candidatus Moranbacteria bacterium]|nr:hypothetical protein [Candidatus Moranbacteria bacterium]
MEKPKEYSPEEIEELEKSRKEMTDELIEKGAGYIPGESRLHITGEQQDMAQETMNQERKDEVSALHKDFKQTRFELQQTQANLERLQEHKAWLTKRLERLKKLGYS